jgi:hypothetical protein
VNNCPIPGQILCLTCAFAGITGLVTHYIAQALSIKHYILWLSSKNADASENILLPPAAFSSAAPDTVQCYPFGNVRKATKGGRLTQEPRRMAKLRVRLRPNRGFAFGLAYNITPHNFSHGSIDHLRLQTRY